jgi:CMP-N,N'-diacetyllegionaminic acid synthase
MTMLKIHAIILARGNSKGIKNKNLTNVNGKPLIYWSIKASLLSKKINKVWVSSDSKKILSISKKFGANIITRPKKLSSDTASSENGWVHAIKFIKSKEKITHVVALQPTSPLRQIRDLDNALIKYFKNKSDSLFSANQLDAHFTWKLKKNISPNYKINLPRKMRQSIKTELIENGSFYIFSSKKFLKNKRRLFGKINFYLQNKLCKFEIDDKEDLLINKIIFSQLKKFKDFLH